MSRSSPFSLTSDPDRLSRCSPPRRRLSGALGASVVAHVLVLLALVVTMRSRDVDRTVAQRVEPEPERIVWLAIPGPSGGGGEGRPAVPAPRPVPPRAQRTAEPVAPVPQPIPEPVDVSEPAPDPPAPEPPAPAVVADSSSSGATNTAASAEGGTDAGPGAGSGVGTGAGDGRDRGFGGGAYRPGNGVSSPVPIRRAPPVYTAAAMRARAQGVVTIECIVEPNGECGDVRVIRTFTPPHGLDHEAIAAARRWRFRPGMREGQPVPVRVNLEIEFNIR